MSTEIILSILGVGSNFITWFLTRRKYNAEVDSSTIQNMKASLEFYTKLSDDNKERLEEVIAVNADLRSRNEKLEAKNDKLEEDINKIRNEMFNLMGQICLNMQCSVRQRNIPIFNMSNSTKYNNNDSKPKKKIQGK